MNEAKKKILNVSAGGHFMALTTIVKRGNRNFIELINDLARINERLCKSDFSTREGPLGQLVQVRMGQQAICSMMLIHPILMELQKHDESFTAEEWLSTETSKGENALQVAERLRMVPRIFRSEVWKNNVGEMEVLWSHLTESAKASIEDFTGMKFLAEQQSRPVLDVLDITSTRDLTGFNPAVGYAPLGDRRTWKQWGDIVTTMELHSEAGTTMRLTKADLLEKGDGNLPFLRVAALAGVLRPVRDYLEKNGEKLGRQDYLAAGLGEMVMEADRKLSIAAENGKVKEVISLIEAGVADLENRTNNNGSTPLMRAAAKGQGDVMKALLDAGADADARAESDVPLSVLWLTSKYCGSPAMQLVLDGLNRKYGDDVLKILDCLTLIHEGRTPVQCASKQDSGSLVDKAIKKAVTEVVKMPGNMLTEHVSGRRSGLEILDATGSLPMLFTADRWGTDVRGMHKMAGQLSKEALDRQLSGKGDIPTYADVLARTNASVFKRGLGLLTLG